MKFKSVFIAPLVALLVLSPTAHAATDAYWRSVISKACLESPFALGTDNQPITDEKATTIVNIWGFVHSSNGSLAWLYKNESGQFSFQPNWKEARILERALPRALAQRWVIPPKSPGEGPSFYPVHLTNRNVDQLERILRTKGFVRTSCFRGDLPSWYTGTASPDPFK